MSDTDLRSRFEGAILGTMVGDALGAPVEDWDCGGLNAMLDGLPNLPEAEREKYYSALGQISGADVPAGKARYTDDTQMTLGVAESLVAVQGFDAEHMAHRFAENFQGHRGYGPGAYAVLSALRQGAPVFEPARQLFGGEGSYGNGAAMRVAPLGLFFHQSSTDKLRLVVKRQSEVTHTHPLAIEGAVLQAAAVSLAVQHTSGRALDPFDFLGKLRLCTEYDIYLKKLGQVESLLGRDVRREQVALLLGNDTSAPLSVPAAIYASLAHPGSFSKAVLYAVRLGGDTDTIGAMCGAIAGALHGVEAIPLHWLAAQENGPKGRDYVRRLANDLFDVWQQQAVSS